jgi:hypothetical protein
MVKRGPTKEIGKVTSENFGTEPYRQADRAAKIQTAQCANGRAVCAAP